MAIGLLVLTQSVWAQSSASVAQLAGASEQQHTGLPEKLLRDFGDNLHLTVVEERQESVVDYTIGLGAMKKVRGVWALKESERVTGQLTSITWQVLDGFSAAEVLAQLEALYGVTADDSSSGVKIPSAPAEASDTAEAELPGSKLLFGCDGRACGHGAQWASRVFGQRLLYGRGDAQQYRAYSLEQGGYRLIAYGSVRSTDRQYIHVELIRLLAFQ